jgi:hypothetical protein
MKTLIDKNTMNYLTFAEDKSEVDLCDIDCTDGLQRWTDSKYRFFLNGKMPKEKIALPENKYRTLTNNGDGTYTIIGMSAEDISTIEFNEKKEAKMREFKGKRFKISIKLDDLEDGTGKVYKELQKMFKWCTAANHIFTDGFLKSDIEYLAAFMDVIVPKHQTLIDAANGLLTVEDIEDEQTWQVETIIVK